MFVIYQSVIRGLFIKHKNVYIIDRDCIISYINCRISEHDIDILISFNNKIRLCLRSSTSLKENVEISFKEMI